MKLLVRVAARTQTHTNPHKKPSMPFGFATLKSRPKRIRNFHQVFRFDFHENEVAHTNTKAKKQSHSALIIVIWPRNFPTERYRK